MKTSNSISGLRTMNYRSRIMLCLLSALSVQANSQDADDREGGTIAETESRFLFINMLEFLGEFETEDGEWVSPELLGNEAFADLDTINAGEAEIIDQARQEQVLSVTGEED